MSLNEFASGAMKKFFFVSTIILIILAVFLTINSQDMLESDKITYRSPINAGAFYSKKPEELKRDIQEFLQIDKPNRIDARIVGIVVPHAGYVFSGWVAGKAYREVAGGDYDVVVVIGPSHYKSFKGASIFNGDAYSTPLGAAKVDKNYAKKIAEYKQSVYLSNDGHEWQAKRGEHSIEVQIPFLLTVLPDVPIVPISMGSQDFETIDALTKAIVFATRETGKKPLLVASSDLSHFHEKREAERLDSALIRSVESYDYFKLTYHISARKWEACGGGPISVVMQAAEQLGADAAEPLQYATSADSPNMQTGDDRVVGYYSAAFVDNGADEDDKFHFPDFSEQEREVLMKSAINGVKSAVTGDNFESNFNITENLTKEFGAFVTLKKQERLRGCVGFTFSSEPIISEVREAGKNAAVRDTRFSPVKSGELGDLHFEVTILSRFKRVLDPQEIQVGKDGVYLRVGYNSGLFLPQVAPEQNWDRETFLEQLGRKAGLSLDAYKSPDAELYKFRAVIIQ